MSYVPLALPALLVDDSSDDAELIIAELRRARFELDAMRVETRDQLAAALAGREWDIVHATTGCHAALAGGELEG